MIRFLTLALLLAVLHPCATAAGERPLSVQGTIRDSSGTPLSGNHAMHFAVYDVDSGGTALWSQSMPAVPFTNGIYSVVLDNTIPAAVFASSSTKYLGITLDTNDEFTPRQQWSAAPYANYAAEALHAATATSADSADSVTRPTSIITGNIVNSSSAASTTYFPPNGMYAGTETESSAPFPATTLRKLQVQLTAAPGSGNSITITVMREGSATSLACTISGSATYAISNNAMTISEGDLVSIRYAKTTTSSSTMRVKYSFICQ